MRYSCTSCDASLQTAAARAEKLACPSCGGELRAEADVYHLRTDRDPTRRYDLEELKARLTAEKEAIAALERAPAARTADQVWFVGVHGRQVGPLTLLGLSGLRTRGQLAPATLVWREGFPSWVSAEAVPELRPLLGLLPAKPVLPFEHELSRSPSPPPPPRADEPPAQEVAQGQPEQHDEVTAPGVQLEAQVIQELAAAEAPPASDLPTMSLDLPALAPPPPDAPPQSAPPQSAPPSAEVADPALGEPAGRDEITKVARTQPPPPEAEPKLEPPPPFSTEPDLHPLPQVAPASPEVQAVLAAAAAGPAGLPPPAPRGPFGALAAAPDEERLTFGEPPSFAQQARASAATLPGPASPRPAEPPAAAPAPPAPPATKPKRGYRPAAAAHGKARAQKRSAPPPARSREPAAGAARSDPAPAPAAARTPPPSRTPAPLPLDPVGGPSFGERPAPPNLSRKIAAGLAVLAALVAAALILSDPPQPPKGADSTLAQQQKPEAPAQPAAAAPVEAAPPAQTPPPRAAQPGGVAQPPAQQPPPPAQSAQPKP